MAADSTWGRRGLGFSLKVWQELDGSKTAVWEHLLSARQATSNLTS